MKYDLLRHAFYMAEHIPTYRDMMKLHWHSNALDITVKAPTKHFIGLVAKIKL